MKKLILLLFIFIHSQKAIGGSKKCFLKYFFIDSSKSFIVSLIARKVAHKRGNQLSKSFDDERCHK